MILEISCGALTGQVPPAIMRSKDNAAGMPWLMPEFPDSIDSLIDFCFSSPLIELLEDAWAFAGRR